VGRWTKLVSFANMSKSKEAVSLELSMYVTSFHTSLLKLQTRFSHIYISGVKKGNKEMFRKSHCQEIV